MQIIYKTCAECGKKFTGDYDWKQYAYKIEGKVFCGWDCLRKYKAKNNKKEINKIMR